MTKKHANQFESSPMERMAALGRVSPESVRFWLRSAAAGEVRARCWPEGNEGLMSERVVRVEPGNLSDNTAALTVPLKEASNPCPNYSYRIEDENKACLGEGRFNVPALAGSENALRDSLAIMSCHQPFDNAGRVREDALQMLKAVRTFFERSPPSAVFTLGDQMYADSPPGLSLFNADHFAQVAPKGRDAVLDCTEEEVRRLLQARYRLFWNQSDWRWMHSRFTCYPMMDDHEIVDNWGSAEEHQKPAWENYKRGAFAAYQDYQGSRILEPKPEGRSSFHYDVDHGCWAAFVMDLRTERTGGDEGRLFSDRQRSELIDFLKRNERKAAVFLVFTVPVIHLPRFLAHAVAQMTPFAEDFSDRWSTGAHVRDRDEVLKILNAHQRNHPRQRVVLLSGDIHIGCLHEIRWNQKGPSLCQFVSSAVTHSCSLPVQWASKTLIHLNRRVKVLDGSLSATIHHVAGVNGRRENPIGRLNIGCVDVDATRTGEPARLRFSLIGHRAGEPVRAYESPWM